MTEPLTIKPKEQGVIRLFALDLAEAQIATFVNPRTSHTGGAEVWPLRIALGLPELSAAGIEVIKVENLAGIGLMGYLNEGQGISLEALEPYRAAIEGLTGHVVILHPSAAPQGGTIDPQPPLSHIATLAEAPPDTEVGELTADLTSAPAKPKKSDARVGGMVATYALIAMFAIVALIIWIAS